MNPKILIVDDDRKTVELIRLYLENDGFEVVRAYDGEAAINQARQETPDLIVLDLMLPKADGIDVFRAIRAESAVPIIMLTARTTEDDKLVGLNIGADDYITKPFSPREVIARVRAVLRRSGEPRRKAESLLMFGDMVIDFARYEARIEGKPIHLTPKEFKLLEILSRNSGRPISRAELVMSAFGDSYRGLDRTVDVHVMNLRKKIETSGDRRYGIKTVYGIGYKFTGVERG